MESEKFGLRKENEKLIFYLLELGVSEKSGGDEQRRTNDWLPREELDRERVVFIAENRQQFLDFFQSDEHFSDLDPESQEKGAELMARFFFGIYVAYRRFGNKYPIYELGIDYGDLDIEGNYRGVGFCEERNGYIIGANFIKETLKDIKERGGKNFLGGGIGGLIPADDFFEIGGVEEAAHLMFFNEKGQTGGGEVPGGKKWDIFTKGLTSDIESRALLWKLAYVKRYMPQYYDSLRKTTKEVTRIRMEARKKEERQSKKRF